MATSYSPSIITNGLVLALDSTNPQSYPGSGTTWYDLSGKGNNGTLYDFSGPGAGSTSGYDTNTGYMMFDRHLGGSDGTVNNRVVVLNSDTLDGVLCQNGMTIDYWFRETAYVCTAMTKWDGSWEVYYCSGLVFRTQGTGGTDMYAGVNSSAGTWRHLVATHDGTTAKFYVNGVETMNTSNTVTNQNTTANIAIGAYESGIYASYGALPIYRLYDRPLSSTEVLQNYNAQRTKFGV